MSTEKSDTAVDDTSVDVLDPAKVQEALTPEQDELDPEAKLLESFPPEQRLIALKLLPALRASAAEGNEARVAKRLKALQTEFEEQAKKAIQVEVDKLRESNKPPNKDELELLLNQDYIEFKIKLKGKEQEYVISELTQEQEMKFLRSVTKKLIPYAKEISSVDWQTGKYEDKLKRLIEIIPEGLEMLSQLAAIALDPTEKDITPDWVKQHLSSSRIMRIVEAQILAGRVRDFFSGISRLLPSGTIG